MGDCGRLDAHRATNHHSPCTAIDHHPGLFCGWYHLEILEHGDEIDPIARALRCRDSHSTAVQGACGSLAQVAVDRLTDALRIGKVRLLEIQHQLLGRRKGAAYGFFHRSSTWNASCSGGVHGKPGSSALCADARNYHVALGHGIDLAIGPIQRCHQQRPPTQAAGIPHGRYRDINGLPRACKWWHIRMHRHGGYIAQAHKLPRRDRDALLEQHVAQCLYSKRGLGSLIAGLIKTGHQAVANQLVGTNPRPSRHILDALGLCPGHEAQRYPDQPKRKNLQDALRHR